MLLDAPYHPEIHGSYMQVMRRLYDLYHPKRVLKTDCWNETHACPFPLAPIHNSIECMEIDEGAITAARSRFPELKIAHGDIRKMPFEYSEFDALVDFSTIDHIHDYRMALKEYGRVVKNGGVVLITVWTSTNKQEVSSDPDVYTLDPTDTHRQYYFDSNEFMESILATGVLRVQAAGVYPHFITGERRLSWFHCIVYK